MAYLLNNDINHSANNTLPYTYERFRKFKTMFKNIESRLWYQNNLGVLFVTIFMGKITKQNVSLTEALHFLRINIKNH